MKQCLCQAPIGQSHTYIGFQSIWKAMIQYPLHGAMCITVKQCQKIQVAYLPTFLVKMGINQTTATAVQHGPINLGSLNIFDLETEQGMMQTKLVIAHLHKK